MAAQEQANRQPVSSKQFLRRVLFLLMVAGFVIFYIFLDFRGLSSAKGMDQAQIARELTRGNGFSTRCLRPLELHYYFKHLQGKGRDVNAARTLLEPIPDTYHAPLNPLINSIVLRIVRGVRGSWDFDTKKEIRQQKENLHYPYDRAIAATSAVFLLGALGLSFLLISRIFDRRIAVVSTALLVLSTLFWEFAGTGLPQLLMLFLFSLALYFLYKGIEYEQLGRSPLLWIILAAGFFGLLALAHWMAVWIFIGCLIFVSIYFRPRGVMTFVMVAVFLVIVTPWLIRNQQVSGSFLGSAVYSAYTGLAGSEDSLMRDFDPTQQGLEMTGILKRIAYGAVNHLDSLYAYLGSLVVAPLFFLSLLHPFRRPEIAVFRWSILLMWVFAVIGMTFFGLSKGRLDSNQLNVLFVPMMVAYGLAMLSVLWNRLGLPANIGVLRNGHFIIAIAISVIPFLVTMPTKIFTGNLGRFTHYPPYHPKLFSHFKKLIGEREVVMSDLPWAISWYADRTSLWLPKDVEQFDELYRYVPSENQHNIGGVILTPVSTDRGMISLLSGPERAWAPLILSAPLSRPGQEITFPNFPFRVAIPMTAPPAAVVFYADRARQPREVKEE